jgi:hypothetical protein
VTVSEVDRLYPLYRDTEDHLRPRKGRRYLDNRMKGGVPSAKSVVGKLRPSRRPKGL